MKSSLIFAGLPVATYSFAVNWRACPRASTTVRSSWDSQQQHPDGIPGYQQYSNEDQTNQQYVEETQGYEQYYEQYSAGNQGVYQDQYSHEAHQGHEQYPAQDNQDYAEQNQVYQQFSVENQHQQYENQGYQQDHDSSTQAENYEEQNAEVPSLILNGLDQEMSKMASNFSFTESDYLAAARRRAELRVESSNAGATTEEWFKVANEKKQELGEIDDWENSAKEAGNTDSQILMFTEAPADGDDDEPKLLLF